MSVFFLLISCYYLINFDSAIFSFSLIKYLLKKFIRLWPLYAIAITITVIVIHMFPLLGRMSTWTDWILNLTFINGFLGSPYVDGAHWYLTTLISFIIISGIGGKLKIEKNPFFLFWNNYFILDFCKVAYWKYYNNFRRWVLLHFLFCMHNQMVCTEKELFHF